MYADEGLIGEYTATGTEIRTYGWKLGSTWGTDPLFMKIGSQYYFYHNDHLGTPQKMTSISGAVVWSVKYSSFGKAEVDSSSTIENNLRFPGQYFDGEAGFHYNLWRYYNPNSGRYIKADPVGSEGGINWFQYVSNNPVKLTDPWGLFQYYHRWGGPDYTAGIKGKSWETLSKAIRKDVLRQIQNGWDPYSPYEPYDEQDTCYMYHDICYGERRIDCRSQKGCFNDCVRPKLNKCDNELMRCLIKIGMSGDALSEAHRLSAIPVFVIQPKVRTGYHNFIQGGRTPPTSQ